MDNKIKIFLLIESDFFNSSHAIYNSEKMNNVLG